nr:MAG TPA: hypothetical protein [Caudoviricetes sp.]
MHYTAERLIICCRRGKEEDCKLSLTYSCIVDYLNTYRPIGDKG